MDSTPSPITPAYTYNDSNVGAYESMLRQDLNGYVPSPTTVTPFLDQQMLITPSLSEQYSSKFATQLPPAQYPALASSPARVDVVRLPTPPSPNNSGPSSGPPGSGGTSASTTIQSKPSASDVPTATTGKKNKYPCPYAQSHSCSATFTTSGHAARHGKKHTGEKGVHCPVCNKAFTRKDNMKQHERTHKGSLSGNSDDSGRRSKAAITKDVQRFKQAQKGLQTRDSAGKTSFALSPLPGASSLAPAAALEPRPNPEESAFYPEPAHLLMAAHPMPESVSAHSLYPPLGDDSILGASVGLPQPQPQRDKTNELCNTIPMPPTLVRGFSDLDTLAQAAESFDPYDPPGL